MITIRDAKKNIRIIKRGNVPIPDRCYEYEKSAMRPYKRYYKHGK
jgi:hypothetical protein